MEVTRDTEHTCGHMQHLALHLWQISLHDGIHALRGQETVGVKAGAQTRPRRLCEQALRVPLHLREIALDPHRHPLILLQ